MKYKIRETAEKEDAEETIEFWLEMVDGSLKLNAMNLAQNYDQTLLSLNPKTGYVDIDCDPNVRGLPDLTIK